MALGRQSQPHLDLARKFLIKAREASRQTRTGCTRSLPHLVRAVESLSAAWEHLGSVSDAKPPRGRKIGVRAREQRVRQTRAKRELQEEYADIQKIVGRDLGVYIRRCTREPK